MSALTAKGAATRARIVAGAAAEIRANGVAGTTLDDVRAHTRTSKGQIFHYFPGGRDELLLAVAELEAERVLDDQQPHLGRLTTWAAWRAWRDTVVDRYRRQGQHCALSVLVTQLGRDTPGTRAVLGSLFARWEGDIAAGIRTMQAAMEIAPSVDADREAAALVAGVQGGVVVLLSTGSTRHLEAALDAAIDRLGHPGVRPE